MRGEDRVLMELRQLVGMLEQSGLAERRPDAAALLAASRARLAMSQAPRRPRPPPRGRPRGRIGAKLGLLLLDAVAVAALVFGAVGLAAGNAEPLPAVAALAVALAIAFLRLPALREAAAEAGFHLLYHVRWAWLWLAEAFSDNAALRLDALLYGREVMWAWRQHARSLLHRPSVADVEAFLAAAYAQPAAAQFRAMLTAAPGAGGLRDARARVRQPSVRGAFLLPRFEALALSGALWAEEDAAPPPPAARVTLPPATILEPESPERTQRRADLRDLIRRKRDEINVEHGWRLKTPAEIAQRDAHLEQLRNDIRALEAELKAMDAG
jgi:hypothetical protein